MVSWRVDPQIGHELESLPMKCGVLLEYSWPLVGSIQ
jgi:hypothetical protein